MAATLKTNNFERSERRQPPPVAYAPARWDLRGERFGGTSITAQDEPCQCAPELPAPHDGPASPPRAPARRHPGAGQRQRHCRRYPPRRPHARARAQTRSAPHQRDLTRQPRELAPPQPLPPPQPRVRPPSASTARHVRFLHAAQPPDAPHPRGAGARPRHGPRPLRPHLERVARSVPADSEQNQLRVFAPVRTLQPHRPSAAKPNRPPRLCVNESVRSAQTLMPVLNTGGLMARRAP